MNTKLAGTVTRFPRQSGPVTLEDARSRFLRRDAFEPSTAAAYSRTLDALAAAVGSETPVEMVTREMVEDLLADRWGQRKATTYNRHMAALSSFFSWCADRDWITVNPAARVEPRKVRRLAESEKRDRPIPRALLAELWAVPGVAVRDRLLWRMAYETWGRADELLTLNVADLVIPEREGSVHAKGGDVEPIWWSTGTARLLPKVLEGRTTGPLFIASKLPSRPMPVGDLDPATGRARLSYRQAERIFADVGQRLDPSNIWTLHRLRHSGIAHAVEDGWNLAQIRAKSRHKTLRSLEVYANPSADSVRAMTNALDPAARRRD